MLCVFPSAPGHTHLHPCDSPSRVTHAVLVKLMRLHPQIIHFSTTGAKKAKKRSRCIDFLKARYTVSRLPQSELFFANQIINEFIIF